MPTAKIEDSAAKPATFSWTNAGAVLLAGGLVVTMLVGILLRPIYLDERANLEYLWLIAQGEHPYRDFWCHYPVAGYAFFLPVFNLMPAQAGVVIILRAYSVLFIIASLAVVCGWSRKLSGCWWLPLFPALFLVNAPGTVQGGLARVLTEFRLDAPAMLLAFISIALLFGDARGWKRVLSVACAVVSFVVMPKYVYILAACHALDLLGRWFGKRLTSRILLDSAVGGVAGVAIAWGLTQAMHANLLDAWRWSILLHARYQAGLSLHANFPQGYFMGLVVPFIEHDLWACLPLALGVGGFFVWAKRRGWGDQRAWIGYGLLLGVVVTVWRTVYPFNQYLPQGFLPLLFFFPFLAPLWANARRRLLVESTLLGVMAIALAIIGRNQVRDVAVSTLFNDITQENALIAVVPENEKVLGMFPVLFRKPVMFVMFDEIWGEPRGFSSLVQDDPVVAREFTPERLREVLQQTRPALIHLTISYPPGWLPMVEEYLRQNAQYYQQISLSPSSDIRNDAIFIRKDLLK